VRIHYLQHVASEDPGSIRQWAEAGEYNLTSTHLYRGEASPDLKDFDWLVVMGGPMSVNDVSAHPWLIAEKSLIAQAIAEQKVVLGICLGAQLIASAMGAEVYRNRFPEIGWLPVRLTPEAGNSQLFGFLPEVVRVFHWHGETFNLPAGATRIAESDACANHAFVYGTRVIGMQFHPESTRESVRAILAESAADLAPGPYVQSRRSILGTDEDYNNLRSVMFGILDRLASTT
jgi:GMP synthase-like glutamine amidotransferase